MRAFTYLNDSYRQIVYATLCLVDVIHASHVKFSCVKKVGHWFSTGNENKVVDALAKLGPPTLNCLLVVYIYNEGLGFC